ALHLVQVDDGLDRLLLAEEEALAHVRTLLVPFEPPVEETPRHCGGTWVAGFAPGTHLIAKLVDEVVPLFGAGEEILEEAGLLADDARDAPFHVLGRGEEAHRRPPALGELRAAAGEELIVLPRLLEGVADDDTIDNVGHRRASLRQVPHDSG